MKRIMPISIVLLAVALVAVSVYRSSAAGPATMPAASGQKWEYAELQTGVTDPNAYVFTTADFQATAGGATELLAKMGGKTVTGDEIKKDRSLIERTYLALLNQIGSQGWEMVSVAPDGSVYLFKRPAQK